MQLAGKRDTLFAERGPAGLAGTLLQGDVAFENLSVDTAATNACMSLMELINGQLLAQCGGVAGGALGMLRRMQSLLCTTAKLLRLEAMRHRSAASEGRAYHVPQRPGLLSACMVHETAIGMACCLLQQQPALLAHQGANLTAHLRCARWPLCARTHMCALARQHALSRSLAWGPLHACMHGTCCCCRPGPAAVPTSARPLKSLGLRWGTASSQLLQRCLSPVRVC